MAIGEVTVNLGGADHVLRFRLRAWAALEDRGFKLDDVIAELNSGKLNFKAFEALLWAMLQHEKPAPSVEQVGEWVGGENFPEVIAKIGEAMRDAFPAPDPPMPALANVGAGSGPEA